MDLTLDKMLAAGMHLGHKAQHWNPKMKPFIHTVRNNLHIIDLIKTCRHLLYAFAFAKEAARRNKTFLFVGTKKQAKPFVAYTAEKCQAFYVNEKWVGGLLTNWGTVCKSTDKLRLLERQEKNGFLDKLPKKERAKKLKEKEKLTTLFQGVKNMIGLPDIVVIVGQREELNALNECNRLGIRTISLMDTNCNPTIADVIIPSNDDSMASIYLLLDQLAKSILEGRALASKEEKFDKDTSPTVKQVVVSHQQELQSLVDAVSEKIALALSSSDGKLTRAQSLATMDLKRPDPWEQSLKAKEVEKEKERKLLLTKLALAEVQKPTPRPKRGKRPAQRSRRPRYRSVPPVAPVGPNKPRIGQTAPGSSVPVEGTRVRRRTVRKPAANTQAKNTNQNAPSTSKPTPPPTPVVPEETAQTSKKNVTTSEK